jgi:hypothetical protein
MRASGRKRRERSEWNGECERGLGESLIVG